MMKPKKPELLSLQVALGTVIHEERWGINHRLNPEEQRMSDSAKVVILERVYQDLAKGRRL